MCIRTYAEFGCSDWHEESEDEPRMRFISLKICPDAQRLAMAAQQLGLDVRFHVMAPTNTRQEIEDPEQIAINMQRACPECEKKALDIARHSREEDLRRVRAGRRRQGYRAAPERAPDEEIGEVARPRMAETPQFQDFAEETRDTGFKLESDSEQEIKEESPNTSRPAGPSGGGRGRRSR
ncbi:hypothetical protein OCU04_012836 [Sclerotinia nivalis]|uniref:Uncharacterized protein n=1 Tax=Sclerotinia nivalis TaxID=352851 RepID=A0A9X0A9I7_9HELO|nr:hypothetical protein OCU04_012836 [Sclerotinia nivalis]